MNLANLISIFLAYKYLIILIVAILEGPIIMIASGLLLHLKEVSLLPIFLVLMAGDLIGDVVWYFIGFKFAKQLSHKYGKYFSLTPELITKTENIFQKHPIKILFFSKITMGFGLALGTLIVAGMSKVPFKKYMLTLTAGQVILTGMLLSIGYFFGGFYEQIDQSLKTVTLVIFFLVAFLAVWGVRSHFKNANKIV